MCWDIAGRQGGRVSTDVCVCASHVTVVNEHDCNLESMTRTHYVGVNRNVCECLCVCICMHLCMHSGVPPCDCWVAEYSEMQVRMLFS